MSIDSRVAECEARDNKRLDSIKGEGPFVYELRGRYTDEEQRQRDEVKVDESRQSSQGGQRLPALLCAGSSCLRNEGVKCGVEGGQGVRSNWPTGAF